MPFPPVIVYAATGCFLLFFKAVALPIGWFEVYFHELSHGIIALVTGAKVHALELNFNGSGSLTHSGSRLPMAVGFAGYAGTALWGLVLYKAFSPIDRATKNLTLALMGLIAVSALLWVRDVQSLGVVLCLLGILAAGWKLLSDRIASHIMGVTGAGLIVSSAQSARALLGPLPGSGTVKGDAAALATQSLFIPAFVWILLWIAISVLCLVWIYRKERAHKVRFRF